MSSPEDIGTPTPPDARGIDLQAVDITLQGVLHTLASSAEAGPPAMGDELRTLLAGMPVQEEVIINPVGEPPAH